MSIAENTGSSVRLGFSALWSTPYGLELLTYGVLHMALYCCHMECFTMNSWWTLQMLFDVLRMVTFLWHMEYSMRSLFPEVWSASYHCHPCKLWKKYEELHKTCFQCSMEYSIWAWITALWSTSYGASLLPYRVLYNQLYEQYKCCLVYSIWHHKTVIWSTPYRNRTWPFWWILKHSIWHQKTPIWSTPCGMK